MENIIENIKNVDAEAFAAQTVAAMVDALEFAGRALNVEVEKPDGWAGRNSCASTSLVEVIRYLQGAREGTVEMADHISDVVGLGFLVPELRIGEIARVALLRISKAALK